MQVRSPFILASGSPRRRHLLSSLGVEFVVQKADVAEDTLPDESAEDMVDRLSLKKARTVAETRPEALVLGADTTVVLEGEILGKPEDPAAAVEMLARLSGKTHTVLTGITLVHLDSHRARTAVEATHVTFDALTAAEMEDYVATGSPLDKAGGYGIQDDRGALFVSSIQGDFYNVMGLPIRRLYRLLKSDFLDWIETPRSVISTSN